jgi:hypothetical protein
MNKITGRALSLTFIALMSYASLISNSRAAEDNIVTVKVEGISLTFLPMCEPLSSESAPILHTSCPQVKCCTGPACVRLWKWCISWCGNLWILQCQHLSQTRQKTSRQYCTLPFYDKRLCRKWRARLCPAILPYPDRQTRFGGNRWGNCQSHTEHYWWRCMVILTWSFIITFRIYRYFFTCYSDR